MTSGSAQFSSASPNAFAMFATSQSPRESYNMYGDLLKMLGFSTSHSDLRKRSDSASSTSSKWRRMFGL
ncbi:hypothetical protein WOLCODRAFT_24504 [Wolfiporia cocos MD-104 SS10]|uniref:Uncharacterized protein n=1 Tax=Wolfiporia cocos (strain MD-104) TaxID=742152 RepID=A0A2H3JG00_WOLCO|nr:hypothetical protein WOLCODRAFT_24504 [Wolfiporia cocos MD-104 SS10]